MDTAEMKSEYAKRVLFGGSKAGATAAAAAAAGDKDKQAGGGRGSRSGSQSSSTSSAPGSAIYSVPGTPRSTNGQSCIYNTVYVCTRTAVARV